MGRIEESNHVARKPKFVEIPAVPSTEKGSVVSGNNIPCVTNNCSEHVSACQENEATLMKKLGIYFGDQRHVKTTTHIHPMLSNSNIGIHGNELKKHTTSPASTLSDKGIGSSVGSFDSEFRHEASIFHPSRIPYDVSKTGSLDSRTQDLSMTERSAPSHTRSSSDNICQSGPNNALPQGGLAEQSRVTLWNSDPRRLSKLVPASSSLSSSVRPRRPSTRRPKSRTDSSLERDFDARKLPQLCRDSPNHSAHSSVSSSSRSITPAVSVYEMPTSNNHQTNVFSSDPLPPPPPPPLSELYRSCDVTIKSPIPPTPTEMAPPLPPKVSSHQEEFYHQHHGPYQSETNSLNVPTAGRSGRADNSLNTASSTLTGRIRLSSDSALKKGKNNPPSARKNTDQVWSQDSRRETRVPLQQNSQSALSSSVIGVGLGRTESAGFIQDNATRQNVSKLHGSTSALLDDNRPQSHSPYSDNDTVQGDETFTRRTVDRSSTRSNPGSRRRGPTNDAKARFAPYCPPEVNLQSLQFDLPLAVTSESKFVGREWLFNEVMAALNSNNHKTNKGVVILGGTGHGKTSVVDHLVSYSYHGWRNARPNKQEPESLHRLNGTLSRSSSPLMRQGYQHYASSNHSSRTASPAPTFTSSVSSRAGSQTSLTEETSRKMASQVVAFHFCQADNNTTCYVPEFLHSIAAQLTRVPQLTAYRELLINDLHLQNLLSIKNCIQNPSQALQKAILEPLVMLKRSQKLPKSNLVILIDGLNEAELYRPDYGFSILSFLQHHLSQFPDFIKVVATCRSEDRNIVENLPVHFVSLDGDNANVLRDMQTYVSHRVASSSVLANLTLSGKSDPAVAQKQLSQHLLKIANGNFLYLRTTLDLIDQGAIVPKSAGFKVVPMSLHEVFLLQCNLRFKSTSSFDEVRDVLSVALASLYPLKDEQLYQAVCCGLPPNQLSFQAFKQQMERLDGLLAQSKTTGGRIFFHSFFREWLTGQTLSFHGSGTLQSSNRFRVDVKRGYTLLATVLSRQPPERLHKHATLELAHHVLKAGMFKSQSKQAGISASERNAHFMASSSQQLTEALTSQRNLFYPNMKVSKLLLRSGADPNVPSQVFCSAPPLAVVAHTGCLDLAELLLMFGADVNLPATNGMSALTFAAAAGRLHMVQLLLRYQPVLSQVDVNGHTPLLHAISRGHSTVAKVLLSRDLYLSPEHHLVAAEQALVASATTGDLELIEHLLESTEFTCEVNALEPSNGESPLTSAAAHGKTGVCEFLIRRYRASLHYRNRVGFTPLLCAVKHGEWDAADLLLNFGAPIEACDPGGKTPLMMAACHGHLSVLELLLSRGADVNAADKEGLTALGWSALQGHAHCVRSLIGRSNIHHCDQKGRTALDLAAFFGDPQIVDLLLDSGADIGHVDATGMCALDRAIGSQNIAVTSKLLSRGARIQTTSWAMAVGKSDITVALLNHSLEEGNGLYKNMDFDGASEIYVRALKHAGELTNANQPPDHSGKLSDICSHLLLGYSRCLRKTGDLLEAESTATRALELKPHWYEALYARARVLREASRLQPALRDVMDAERTAPQHNLKEIKRLIERIKEEIRRSGSRRSRPPSLSSDINIPVPRPRVNSSSSFHGNPTRGVSHSSSANELSRSYQVRPQSNSLSPLHNEGNPRLIRGNSQESLAESMMSLSAYSNEVGHLNGNVYRPPRVGPQRRPRVPEFHRSMSEDNRGQKTRYYGDEPRSLHTERLDYTVQNSHVASAHNSIRGPFVTDL